MSDEPTLFIVGGRRGRPPRAGTRATSRVEFVVTTAERADLQDVAKMERRSVAAVVRDALMEYVADFRDRPIFLPSGDRFPPKGK